MLIHTSSLSDLIQALGFDHLYPILDLGMSLKLQTDFSNFSLDATEGPQGTSDSMCYLQEIPFTFKDTKRLKALVSLRRFGICQRLASPYMWEEVDGEESVRTLHLTRADWEDKEMQRDGHSGDCDDGGDNDEQLQRGKWGMLISYFWLQIIKI